MRTIVARKAIELKDVEAISRIDAQETVKAIMTECRHLIRLSEYESEAEEPNEDRLYEMDYQRRILEVILGKLGYEAWWSEEKNDLQLYTKGEYADSLPETCWC